MSRKPLASRTLARAAVTMAIATLTVVALVLPAQAGAAPHITSFNPNHGPVGTNVTLNGTGFGPTTSVTFNNTNAPGFSVNGAGTQIGVSVPGGATSGPIRVITPNETAITSTFTVESSGSAPNISSFNPATGPVGTTVTIHGARFTGVTSVHFHGTNASFAFSSDSLLTATVPSGATTGTISVTTPAGTGTSATAFTVTGVTIPKITGFNPNSGNEGTAVSILGSGFSGTTSVKFNGTAVASFVVVTNGKITTTVPAGATTGHLSVTNPLGTAVSAGTFTVTGPRITDFSPTRGVVGTTVTIVGSRFTGVNAVKFNGLTASFGFVTDAQVTAVVPSGATTGKITLTTPSGTATSVRNFTVMGVHPRSITLSIGHRGRFASGQVGVKDGYAACQQFVPVVIKRLHHGHWRWVLTASTKQNGTYRSPIPDRPGRYRAKAKRLHLANGAVCGGARSAIVHLH